MTITGGVVSNNNATVHGGGIIVQSESTLYIKGGTISNNTAPEYNDLCVWNGGQIIDER